MRLLARSGLRAKCGEIARELAALGLHLFQPRAQRRELVPRPPHRLLAHRRLRARARQRLLRLVALALHLVARAADEQTPRLTGPDRTRTDVRHRGADGG